MKLLSDEMFYKVLLPLGLFWCALPFFLLTAYVCIYLR